jgi:hypothetical protein
LLIVRGFEKARPHGPAKAGPCCRPVIGHRGREIEAGAHPCAIQLEGDTAVGRSYVAEFGRFRGGASNPVIYHDRY